MLERPPVTIAGLPSPESPGPARTLDDRDPTGTSAAPRAWGASSTAGSLASASPSAVMRPSRTDPRRQGIQLVHLVGVRLATAATRFTAERDGSDRVELVTAVADRHRVEGTRGRGGTTRLQGPGHCYRRARPPACTSTDSLTSDA